MKKIAMFSFVFLAVAGCTPYTPPAPELFLSDTTIAEKSVTCEKDDYKKTEFCFSPMVDHWKTPYNGHKSNVNYYFGIAHHNKKAEPYIIGYLSRSDWYFLKEAVDIDGNRLGFTERDREVNSGYHSVSIMEEFDISLTRDYLKKHKDTGINIKLYGKRGDAVIDIPPAYVEGFYNFLLHNN